MGVVEFLSKLQCLIYFNRLTVVHVIHHRCKSNKLHCYVVVARHICLLSDVVRRFRSLRYFGTFIVIVN